VPAVRPMPVPMRPGSALPLGRGQRREPRNGGALRRRRRAAVCGVWQGGPLLLVSAALLIGQEGAVKLRADLGLRVQGLGFTAVLSRGGS
jgi:hypothetical protein